MIIHAPMMISILWFKRVPDCIICLPLVVEVSQLLEGNSTWRKISFILQFKFANFYQGNTWLGKIYIRQLKIHLYLIGEKIGRNWLKTRLKRDLLHTFSFFPSRANWFPRASRMSCCYRASLVSVGKIVAVITVVTLQLTPPSPSQTHLGFSSTIFLQKPCGRCRRSLMWFQ